MSTLSSETDTINTIIGANVAEYTQWTQESMADGSTIIYNLADDTEYHLTVEQMDTFNQAYADGLVNRSENKLPMMRRKRL